VIFNGGAIGGDCNNGECNGITVNSGRFSLSGVEIRNNKGRGVWVPNNSVQKYLVSGCHLDSNGQGFDLVGSNYLITSNVCADNASSNDFGGGNKLVSENMNC